MRIKRIKAEQSRQAAACLPSQGGFIVVIVLCMTIMLGVLLLGFNYKSCISLRAVDDFRKSEQALNCARAGLNIAIAAIRDISDFHTDKTLLNLFSEENKFDIGNGSCSVTITEESGKLNVNLLKDKNGKLERSRIEQLLRLIDLMNQEHGGHSHIGYGLACSIIDWTDSDDEVTYLPFIKHENAGAESGYYAGLETPYRCKNAPLDMIEEILLVKAVTPDVFDRMRDYVTVLGDGEININCASKRVIESLSERMDAVLAQLIIDRRKIKPFDSITELRDIPGMTDSIYYTIKKTVTVSPKDQYYHVTSRGDVDHISREISAILEKGTEAKNVEVILYKEL
jgi:general secretion pathway protein K